METQPQEAAETQDSNNSEKNPTVGRKKRLAEAF